MGWEETSAEGEGGWECFLDNNNGVKCKLQLTQDVFGQRGLVVGSRSRGQAQRTRGRPRWLLVSEREERETRQGRNGIKRGQWAVFNAYLSTWV